MPYQVALLGAGVGAQHAVAYAQLADLFEIRVLCDQDLSRASALAQTFTRARCTRDIASAIGDPAVDIVDICLPPHLHTSVIMESLACGKHVICEKPVTGNIREAEQVIAEAKRRNRLLMPIFQYRYGHATDQLSALIREDIAGEPLLATLETHWNRDATYYTNPWRGTWRGELGGAVLTHAVHIHDLATQFFGPIHSVNAMLDTRVNPIETEDCAIICMRTTNGALINSSITLGAAEELSRLRFVFRHITVESGPGQPYKPAQTEWRFIARAPEQQHSLNAVLTDLATKTSRGSGGYERQFSEFAKQLAGQPANVVQASDWLASIELVSAIYMAARSGSRINLPLDRSLAICTQLDAQ